MRVKINERFKYIHEDGRSVLRDKLTGTSTNVTYRPEIQAMAYALDVANRDRADAIKQSEQRAKERADMARELSEYKAKAESGRVSIERQAKLLRQESRRADGLRAKLKDTERLLESVRKENDRLRDAINEYRRF